ncbi:MAG TPA: hypothetical protein VFQ85_19080 [Mycobacteriales bacterium]|jgi:hypothetical protein|nr:hypothetical protein [Mycobacteriales bacterium]
MLRSLRRAAAVLVPATALVAVAASPAFAETFSDNFSPCYPTTTVTRSGGPTLFTIRVSSTATCGQVSYGGQVQNVSLQVYLRYGSAVELCYGGNGNLGSTYTISTSCTAAGAPAGVYTVTVAMSMWPYQDPTPASCTKGPTGYNWQDCTATHTVVVS